MTTVYPVTLAASLVCFVFAALLLTEKVEVIDIHFYRIGEDWLDSCRLVAGRLGAVALSEACI